MTCNNLNFIFQDYFDASTLKNISLTPLPKLSLKHTPSTIHRIVQQSEAVMDSPNPTPIIQILENAINPDDYEHPVGEATDDQRKLAYISNYE